MGCFESLAKSTNELLNENVETLGDTGELPQYDELNEPLETPIKESKSLEGVKAPDDVEQIQQISERMKDIKGASFADWQEMTPSQRLEAMQQVENAVSDIQHRVPCDVALVEMPQNEYGYYDNESKMIILNSRYLDGSKESYMETLDTLIHEGRHAYQYYNLEVQQIHPRSGEVNMWKWNESEIGYQSANLYGFEAYAMQPVETDARAFAEDVINTYFEKIG